MGGGSHNSVAVEFKDFVTVIEGPLEQSAHQRRGRRSQEDLPQQADQVSRQHAQPLRSSGRGARLRGGRRDGHHRRQQQKLLSAGRPGSAAAIAPAPTGCRSGRLRRRVRACWSCRRSRINTRSATAIRSIELYHVDGLNHSDNMLIAYLPKEKIVINADLYGPPPAGGNTRECECQCGRVVPQHQAAEA